MKQVSSLAFLQVQKLTIFKSFLKEREREVFHNWLLLIVIVRNVSLSFYLTTLIILNKEKKESH